MSELAPEPFAFPPLAKGRRKRGPTVAFILAGLLAAVLGALVLALQQRGTRVTAGGTGTGAGVIQTDLGYQDAPAGGTGIVLPPKGGILTNNHVFPRGTPTKVVFPGTGGAL